MTEDLTPLCSITIDERKGENMNQEMTVLYDEHTHASLDRREFLKKLAVVAGSAAAANALFPLLEREHGTG